MNLATVSPETNRTGYVPQLWGGVLLACLLVSGPTARAAHFTTGADDASKFGIHEIVLTGAGSAANPFDTLATVTFDPPSGAKHAKTVQAFFDGDHTWRARVYVHEAGDWKWSSRSDTDKGLNGKGGTQSPIAVWIRVLWLRAMSASARTHSEAADSADQTTRVALASPIFSVITVP